MITVEEARKMSDKASLPIIAKETKKLSKIIEKAAKQGCYSIEYECKHPYSIRRIIADKFKENDYRAYAYSYCPSIKIIWSEE